MLSPMFSFSPYPSTCFWDSCMFQHLSVLCFCYAGIPFHWIDIPHFAYPLIYGGTFWVVSSSQLLWVVLHEHSCSIFKIFRYFGCIVKIKLLDNIVCNYVSKFLRYPQTLPQQLNTCKSPPALYKGSCFSKSSPTFVIFSLEATTACTVASHSGRVCFFQLTDDIIHHCTDSLAIDVSTSEIQFLLWAGFPLFLYLCQHAGIAALFLLDDAHPRWV